MSKKRIFISYARSDGETYGKELRKKLVAEFSEEDIWRDRDELEGGVGWWQQIEEALETVEFMVLVATPKAMASAVVRKEWRKARQEGVCVYPVFGKKEDGTFFEMSEINTKENPLPRWMADAHFHSLSKEWDTFVLKMKNPCQAVRVPFFGVPDMPEHFVERPTEFDALVSQLLDKERDNPVAITTSLTGAGGFGKTTLATALCHDENVQTAFDDGVLWVTLGENPNVVGELTKIYRALTDENPGFVDANEGASMLAEKLVERDVLMVIDDVWNPAHLRPFLKGGERCARLITTRNINIALGANASTNEVDEMTPEQAVKMLLAGLEPPDDSAPFEILAKRLGEWALMLEIANGMLRQRIALGNSLEQALAWVEKSLIRRGVDGIKRDDEEQRKRSAVDVLSASFELLNEDEASRLYQLAVFRDDSDISLTSIMKCWILDDFDTEDFLQKFALYSFIRLDLNQGTIRIHDVIREILESKLSESIPIEEAHQQLIASYGLASEKWSNWDSYTWQNIAYHLNTAGLLAELKVLLLNIDFLQAKLDNTNPNDLIADYDTFKGENDTFTDDSIRLVQSALNMSSHVLVKDTDQLHGQLYARLMSYQDRPDIAILLEIIPEQEAVNLLPLYQTMQAAGGALIRRLEGHFNSVRSVALAEKYAISASLDTSLIVWNWQSGELVRRLEGHSNLVNSVAILGDIVISASSDRSLIVWNWQSGELVRRLEGHSNSVMSIAISDDIAISASLDTSLIVWNWQSGKLVRRLEGHSSAVNCIAISGDYAISASHDNNLFIWNWTTGEQLNKLEGHSNSVMSVAISDDIAISASLDTSLIVWNWQSGELVRRLEGHSNLVNCIAISRDIVISASLDKCLIIWNLKTGEQLNKLEGHSNSVMSVAISGNIAISASWDKSLIVWNWKIGEQLQRFKGHINSVMSVAISDNIAISTSEDKSLIVWNWKTGEQLQQLKGHSNWVNSVTISGDIAISASEDTTLIIWNWKTGEQLQQLKGHSSSVNSITTSGDIAISASLDKSLVVWNWKTEKQLQRLEGHSNWVNSVSISGDIAISASYDRTLIIWNWKTGEQLQQLKGHSGPVNSINISGDIAISASYDRTLIIWNWKTGEQLQQLKGHSGSVNSVNISGDIAISASDDKTLIVWNWAKSEKLATFITDSPQNTVAIGDDVIVSGGEDGQVHFFKPNNALRKLLGW